jgi:hypothetical protein
MLQECLHVRLFKLNILFFIKIMIIINIYIRKKEKENVIDY